MKETLEKKYEEFKNVLEVLPVNTKNNRKKKLDFILDEEKSSNDLIYSIRNEIGSRLSKFNQLKVNEDINKLELELEKCNIVNEWNDYNTAYEKMHLDYYLYQLHRYYKEDLVSVNNCIRKIVESFKKVNIILTKDDFDFNNYVSSYMEKIFNNESEEDLKNYFEEVYWKFPELVRTIEVNFKSIYLRNEKKINKYYDDRHKEFLEKHNDSEIYDMRIKLINQIRQLKNRDNCLIFEKFKNKEYKPSDFNKLDIEKKKELYFSHNSYSYSNLEKLYQTLSEYNILLKYNYLLSDMKDRLLKKETFKDLKTKSLKEVFSSEGKIKKLNAKNNGKSLPFMKKKADEKWLFDYNNALGDLVSKYDNIEDDWINDIIYNKLSKDSTVLEILKFISSNYLYFVKHTKEMDENLTINDITDKYNMLKEDVSNNKFTLLNNLVLLDEKQMKQIIVDRYNLENITLTIESLQGDNVEKTIQDIILLINYEDLMMSQIDLDDVKFYLEVKE